MAVVLRNGVVEDPVTKVLGFLQAGWVDLGDPVRRDFFDEADLRRANRGGARISAAEIAAIVERRHAIERAIRAIAADSSLADAPTSVPWLPMRQLFEAFADIHGVGFAKMTKALHPKRPAVIPMLDSVVLKYLENDDLGPGAEFAERGIGLVRGYRRDLTQNRAALRAAQRLLASHGYPLTEVRILDLLIWSFEAE